MKHCSLIEQKSRLANTHFSCHNSLTFQLKIVDLEVPPGPYSLGRIGRVIGDTTSAPHQAAYVI
jgi:hypothetical protein